MSVSVGVACYSKTGLSCNPRSLAAVLAGPVFWSNPPQSGRLLVISTTSRIVASDEQHQLAYVLTDNPIVSCSSGQKVESRMENVPLAKIATDDEIGVYKVRKTFNQKHVDELADDIRTNGIIEPVILTRAKEGDGFSVVCGYNSIAACRNICL